MIDRRYWQKKQGICKKAEADTEVIPAAKRTIASVNEVHVVTTVPNW